jgi:hypothetical protein
MDSDLFGYWKNPRKSNLSIVRKISLKSWANSEYFSLLIGGVFGSWFIGLKNLAPWNYQWLYAKGDGALTQLGFEFFRKQPLIQWPITSVSKYIKGTDLIIPTENGIVNLIGKLVGYVFSGNFQFVGIWLVACFALQGFFGSKLISRFVQSKNERTLGSLIFITAPAFIFRVGSMNHYALAAQWMILFALYLYFDSEEKTKIWSCFLFFAVFTSIYIAPMVTLIYLAQRLKLLLEKKTLNLVSLMSPIIALASGFIFMGYMSMRTSVAGTNFFRLNVLAFVNPGFSDSASFSYLLNHVGTDRIRHVFSEELEGFQYLGTIIIFGVIIGLARVRKSSLCQWQKFLPIVIAAVGMFVFALSNQIFVLQQEFSYWWPRPLIHLREIFRGATRFGWPAYYLFTLYGVIQISVLLRKTKLKNAFFVIVAIMLFESSPGVFSTRNQMAESLEYKSSIQSAKWVGLTANHEHMVIYPNFDLGVGDVTGDAKFWVTRWFDLCKLAVDQNMTTNFGYAPRPLGSYVATQDSVVKASLESGDLQDKTIYFLANGNLWREFSKAHASRADFYEVDGYFVIASKD